MADLAPATLLHLYCPGKRPADQCRTWELLATEPWPPDLHIVHCPGPGLDDNAFALNYWWDEPGDLLTVEQDIHVTLAHVERLRACPEPWCAWGFIVSGGVPWTELPDGSGIGLAKLGAKVRATVQRRPVLGKVPWMDLAAVLFGMFGRPHVHRPLIGHDHY